MNNVNPVPPRGEPVSRREDCSPFDFGVLFSEIQRFTLLQQQIAKNRNIMSSLFKTVLFCGRNNIALRGKRDDDPTNESLQGNFQALLYFRVDSGDTVLQEHLKTSARNVTYVSKTIQNEMINTVGKYLTDQITREVRESKYFSLIADEATDVSNKENRSLVIRFVDKNQTIREEFTGFHLCEEGTSGLAIKNLITNAVNLKSDFRLFINYLITKSGNEAIPAIFI